MRARAIFLSVLMIFSIVAGSIAFAGAAAGTPDGFVTIDDSQVYSDLPDQTPMGDAAHKIADAGVMTSDHDQTLEVLVTNPGRAKDYSDSGTVFGSGPVAIVLTDDVASDGRTVALPAEEIEDVLDHKPELARGTHEDGSPWNSTIEYEDGWMLVDVPHFSDNVVTFSGSVEIGDTFTPGSSTFYDLNDLDAASDPVVNLTGLNNSETESKSWTGVSSQTLDPEAAGTKIINATLTLSAPKGTVTDTGFTGNDDKYQGSDIYVADFNADGVEELAYTNPNREIEIHNLETGEWVANSTYFTIQGADIDSSTPELEVLGYGGSWSWEYLDGTSGGLLADDSMGGSHADVDGDGDEETIASETTTATTTLWYYDYNDGGKVDTGFETSTNSINTYTDHDGDGTPEFVWKDTNNNFRVYHHSDSTSTDLGITGYEIEGGDTDGDGRRELAYRDTNDNLMIYDVEGQSSADTSETVTGRIETADVDGDGADEIIFENDAGDLKVYNPSIGASFVVGSIPSTDGFHEFFGGDLDDDGVDEIAYHDPNYNIVYYDPITSETASIDIGNDGTTDETISYSGGGSNTIEIPSLSPGDTIGFDTSPNVNVTVELTEVAETQDPGVVLNGNETVEHTGTLADGETTSLTLSKSTLKEGTNNVTVDMPELSADAPPMQVQLDYSHDAQDDQNVTYESEKFSERYNVSKTFGSDRVNPELTIPFADEAISIRDAEYRLNGGSWQSTDEWVVSNTTGTIKLPDMTAGDTVDVRTNATKVSVQDGAIQVLEATPAEDKLDSKIEITEHRPDFALDVSGVDDERLFFAESPSWTEPDAHAYVDASGDQKLRLPEAGVGSTTRVQDVPLWIETENDVEVAIEDPDEMQFQVRPGESEDDQIEIEYRDTDSGQAYELADLTNDGRQVDTDTAESPVYFSTLDNLATYAIQETELGGAEEPQGPIQTESDGFPIVLMGSIVAGLGGLLLVVRGVGGISFSGRSRSRSTSRSWNVPVIDYSVSLPSLLSIPLPSWSSSRSSRSSRSTTQQIVLVGGLVIIGVVAIELATPDSLFQTVLAAGALAGETLEELFTIFVGVGALLGMWFLDQRTSESIPTWLMAVSAIVVVVYIIETIEPGILLGPASSGFETVSPLFWLVLIGGGAYLIWGYIRSRNSPDTRVTFQLRGRNK